jgi:hypothetical protein
MLTERSEATTFVCAWCDRVYKRGAWRVADLDTEPQRITHGICEACAGEMVPEPAPIEIRRSRSS